MPHYTKFFHSFFAALSFADLLRELDLISSESGSSGFNVRILIVAFLSQLHIGASGGQMQV